MADVSAWARVNLVDSSSANAQCAGWLLLVVLHTKRAMAT